MMQNTMLKFSTFLFCLLFVSVVAKPQIRFHQEQNYNTYLKTTEGETVQKPNVKKPDQYGFTGVVEAGYVAGGGYFGYDRILLNLIGGYYVQPWLTLGFGTGFRHFTDGRNKSVPLYADARVFIGQRKAQVFFTAAGGVSLNISQGSKGVYLNGSIGSRVHLSGKSFIHLRLGYEGQMMSGWRRPVRVEGVSVGLGLSF